MEVEVEVEVEVVVEVCVDMVDSSLRFSAKVQGTIGVKPRKLVNVE